MFNNGIITENTGRFCFSDRERLTPERYGLRNQWLIFEIKKSFWQTLKERNVNRTFGELQRKRIENKRKRV